MGRGGRKESESCDVEIVTRELETVLCGGRASRVDGVGLRGPDAGDCAFASWAVRLGVLHYIFSLISVNKPKL